MTGSQLLDLTYHIHPMPCDRSQQGNMVTVTEIASGVSHRYNLNGLASKTDDELDQMYTHRFKRKAWHLTREGYIIALSKYN